MFVCERRVPLGASFVAYPIRSGRTSEEYVSEVRAHFMPLRKQRRGLYHGDKKGLEKSVCIQCDLVLVLSFRFATLRAEWERCAR